MIKRTYIFLIVFLTTTIYPMVFDNRYLPLIQKPYISVPCRLSHLRLDIFFISAKRAFGYDFTQDEIGIPEIWGDFDQGNLSRAMNLAGIPNPMPYVWQTGTFPWAMNSKIQAEGFSFSSELALTSHLSAGFYWMFMRLNSGIVFNLNAGDANVTLNEAEALMLDEDRREMLSRIGLNCGFAQQLGMGDLDAYVRYGIHREYAYKFRAIDIGFRLGALFPTGVTRSINNPASIPFGGNGHYGIYGTLDAEFELREDWKLGFWLRTSKRFKKRECVRFPVDKISILFSPFVGTAIVDPGVTIVFLPYFYVENIREGLGMGLQFTLIDHFADKWSSCRLQEGIEVNTEAIALRTPWAQEYLTLNIFYDFGKVKADRAFSPIAFLSWDIPLNFVVGNAVPKAHKVAIGVEFAF